MSVSENIKKVRNDQRLTQEAFAARIGVKRNTVATYEMGRSEPSDAAIMLICKTFGVNEHWLRTGEGAMYERRNSSLLEQLEAEYHLDPKSRELLKYFFELPPDVRELVSTAVARVAELYPRKEQSVAERKPDSELSVAEMRERTLSELADVEEARKRAATTSLVSTTTSGSLKKFGNTS